jgi:hypothetical protein
MSAVTGNELGPIQQTYDLALAPEAMPALSATHTQDKPRCASPDPQRLRHERRVQMSKRITHICRTALPRQGVPAAAAIVGDNVALHPLKPQIAIRP